MSTSAGPQAPLTREGGGASGAARRGDVPVLEATGLSKSYGVVQAVENMSLAVHSREIVALVGDNGAGKSTVAMLSGLGLPGEG
ncbi:MAG TPA: ATP-binding cassette domain-containing protein [Acidimicrobiales bacterium]|nr:ATP-binding cassette domain-containing protein [Acidimicrobiales bacterium]